MGGSASNSRNPAMKATSNDSLQPTKVLVNVTVENSLGAIQVLMSPENTAADLIKAALEVYDREKRRPLLKESDPNRYDLHYSPYTLQGLKQCEKLKNLGSRNFFLCSKCLAVDSAFPYPPIQGRGA
ncbi:uncharacterized protein LOC130735877 [Lotus japonicus]|uniref:uncharacterized protein LOC130735877 n=1 Tax=Lotus japonicus TaxID=34305 RepID=UPI00258F13C8|nr:uncharacterized protein LOC130735877 [Lotus japonicus]